MRNPSDNIDPEINPSDMEHDPNLPDITLEGVREHIDAVDDQITSLLIDRLRLVKIADAIKKEKGLPIRDMVRESQIIERVRQTTDDRSLVRVFRTILDESRVAQGEEKHHSEGKPLTRPGHW